MAAKAELYVEQDKILKLQAFDSCYFLGKIHFEDDGMQNYLVLQPVYRFSKKIANSNHIFVWKSNGLSDESIKSSATSNNSLATALNYISTK